uniref:MYND-type domain-containing protein n=1 Tax=Romanomermis culicivorax TaxID=13658 RepID=A0A915L2Z3_ROMCU
MNATSSAGTTNPMSAGENFLPQGSTETPPMLTSIDIACNYCGAKNGQNKSGEDVLVRLLECSGCRRAFYCSKEHQRLDWRSNHKAVCDYKKNKGQLYNLSSENVISSPRRERDDSSMNIDQMLIDDGQSKSNSSVSSTRQETSSYRSDQRPTVIKGPQDDSQSPASFSSSSSETT